MIIQHNLAAQNVMTQFGITNDNLKKATERLSSGYKINRAADNAAALAISEKKRAQIRGLSRAAKNAQDGISLVQTGDGAMSQTGAILHRMRELAVQALNDAVYQPEDQAKLQMEFDQLQSEIDRINDQTEFNKKPVFEHYADNYSSIEGNRVWSQDKLHVIDSSNSSLTVKYVTVAEDGTEVEKDITLTVPEGIYTTQELMDEIDDVVTALGDQADGLCMEYTDKHTCNMILQNGKELKDVSGGLSYLLFDSFGGNQSGALIGTTVFYPGNPLMVKEGKNDELRFRIEYFDGTSQDVYFKVAEDGYTRSDMIKYLNEYRFADGKTLADYGMKASEYGSASIQIGGESGIITGLKGNMFEIDEDHYDSVFYDNTKYGSAEEVPAVFTGADVLNESDVNYAKFNIVSGQNDILKISVDGGTYVTIQLDEGEYNLADMVTELQKKLDDASLGIKVTPHTISGVITPNGNENYRFSGLTLTGSTIGDGGSIEFDVSGSSAYETLFVKRMYTDTGKVPSTVTGRWNYTGTPYLTGGRVFNATDDFPLKLDASNNSFVLKVTEHGENPKQTTITLTPTVYGDLADLIAEINNQIAGTDFKDKIRAVSSSNQIRLTTVSGNDTVSEISVSKNSTDGYDVLFVGESVTWPTAKEITLLPVKPGADGKITFTSTNNKLTVGVGGETRIVQIPPGSYTPEELVDILNAPDSVLKGKTTEGASTSSSSNISGTTVSKSTSSESGTEAPYTNTGAAGTGGKVDGSTQIKDGTAAWYQLGGTLSSSTVIDGSNDTFSITVNGKACTVQLPHSGTSGYSASELAGKLRDAINAQMSEANKVNVTVSGGHLRFETVAVGEGRTIEVGNSTFLSSVNTKRTNGYTTTTAISSYTYPFTLTSSNNKFTIKIDGVATTVELEAKEYTSLSQIQTELNNKLSSKGVNVTTYGSGLRFERSTAGTGSVSLDISNSGSAGEIIFKSPATATISPVTIPKASSSKPGTVKYSVTLGGNTYTATLTNTSTTDAKTYTAAELQTALNGAVWKLNDGGTAQTPSALGFTVTTSGNSIRFVTTERGSGQSISASTRAEPIVTTTPTIEASLTKNSDGTISIGLKSTSSFTPKAYNSGAVLQPEKGETKVANPTRVTRSFDTRKYKLTTNRPISLPNSVTISDDNNRLRFTYRYQNGTAKSVDIILDNKTYTRAQLQKALQEKLDAALEGSPHEGEGLNVVVGDQITLESKRDGTYSISSLDGGFYENVMKGTEFLTKNEKTSYNAGRLVVDDVYIVGRKDIRNQTTQIEKDENDELTVDITINGNITTLRMILDPGTYNSSSLVKEIQKKLSEQLKAANLPEDMILTGIGVYDSGVEGTDDKNSLFFYLNKDSDLEPGNYAIDGLSGKALFSIFYKTDGEPIPAYVTGTEDITGGVEVKEGENEFSVDVDGQTYTFEIEPGYYKTAEELVAAVDAALKENPDSCLKAGLSGNMLKISYTKLGEHQIGNIQGSAKTAIFYRTSSRYGEEIDEWLQIGANDGQGIKLERYSVSTLNMGINSIAITRPKYANKALNRIDDALKYLSTIRSRYGALENRLGYAVKVDEIAVENTQNSESIDRDADMASEMVNYAKSKILQQVGLSIMSQANQSTQSVLALLG